MDGRDQAPNDENAAGEATALVGIPMVVGQEMTIPDDSSVSTHGSEEGTAATQSDRFMTLTDPEQNLANQIKAAALGAAERIPDVQLVSDFEFVQHALFLLTYSDLFQIDTATGWAADETVQQVLQRISSWQRFRQRFDVQDDLSDAADTMEAFLERYSGLLLYVAADYGPANEHGESPRSGCVVVEDAKEWHWDTILAPPESNWRTFLVGHYYMYQAAFPHFGAMQEGVLHIVETEGRQWKNDISFASVRNHQRLQDDLWSFYPSHVKAMQLYNTTNMTTGLYKLLRPFIGEQFRRKFQMGLTVDEESNGQRLSELFSSITPDILQGNMLSLLRERWENETAFVLE